MCLLAYSKEIRFGKLLSRIAVGLKFAVSLLSMGFYVFEFRRRSIASCGSSSHKTWLCRGSRGCLCAVHPLTPHPPTHTCGLKLKYVLDAVHLQPQGDPFLLVAVVHVAAKTYIHVKGVEDVLLLQLSLPLPPPTHTI